MVCCARWETIDDKENVSNPLAEPEKQIVNLGSLADVEAPEAQGMDK